MPIAAMVFGFFFFREISTVLSIAGLIIVLIALAMLVLSDKKAGSCGGIGSCQTMSI